MRESSALQRSCVFVVKGVNTRDGCVYTPGYMMDRVRAEGERKRHKRVENAERMREKERGERGGGRKDGEEGGKRRER